MLSPRVTGPQPWIADMDDMKPFWQSTTMNGLLTAIGGLLAIVVPVLLPKLTSVDVSTFWAAVVQIIGAIANAVGIVVATYGRVNSDGAKLTLTRK